MSEEVAILTAEPFVVEPIVIPSMVTLNSAGEIEAPIVVIITDVVVVGLQYPEKFGTRLLPVETIGVIDVAKKFGGKYNVIVPPEGMGFAGVKARVTLTPDLPETRSSDRILKKTSVIGGKIAPE